MREHVIAHGDLQHGNIIVQDDGTIRLVDYDGCYVPELAGLKSNEKSALALIIILPTALAVLALLGGFAKVVFGFQSAPVIQEYVQVQNNLKAAEDHPVDESTKRFNTIREWLKKGLRSYDSRRYGAAMEYYQRGLDLDKGGTSVIDAREKGMAYMNLADCKRHENFGGFLKIRSKRFLILQCRCLLRAC